MKDKINSATWPNEKRLLSEAGELADELSSFLKKYLELGIE